MFEVGCSRATALGAATEPPETSRAVKIGSAPGNSMVVWSLRWGRRPAAFALAGGVGVLGDDAEEDAERPARVAGGTAAGVEPVAVERHEVGDAGLRHGVGLLVAGGWSLPGAGSPQMPRMGRAVGGCGGECRGWAREAKGVRGAAA